MHGGLRKRDVDLVKTIAVVCVVCIHACGNGYYRPVGSFDWVCTVFWGSISRAGVPLFLMCSGALMLDPAKPLPMKKLYGRSILRLLLALFFWAAVYGAIRLAMAEDLNPAALWELGKKLLLFRHESHLYYLHIMLLVYALLPVVRILTAQASRRQLQYVLALWFLLGIVHPTVIRYWPFRLVDAIPMQWGLNMTWASVGYCILGWYLYRYANLRKRVSLLLLMLGFCATFFGTWALSAQARTFVRDLLGGMQVSVCLMAVGIYGLCLGTHPGRWTEFFSGASFCIYLSHMLFLLLFRRMGFSELSMPCAVSVPLLTAAVLACSTFLYLLLRRVPFAKRWLV